MDIQLDHKLFNIFQLKIIRWLEVNLDYAAIDQINSHLKQHEVTQF